MTAEFTGTGEVLERHRFDVAALDAWLRGRVAGYAGPLRVELFKGGQSNPTFLLTTPTQRYGARGRPGVPGDGRARRQRRAGASR